MDAGVAEAAEAIRGRYHFGVGTFARGLNLSADSRTPFASRRQRGPHRLVEPVMCISSGGFCF